MNRYLAVLAGALLAACTTKTAPALHDFGNPQATLAVSAESRLTVDAPKWFWDTAIHYRLLYASPTTLRAYQLDRWIAPPPELLQQQLQAGISLAMPLTIRLLAFEQQFDSRQNAHVELSFAADYADTKNPRSRLFRLRQPCLSADAAGAANAFAKVAKQAVHELRQWLVQPSSH